MAGEKFECIVDADLFRRALMGVSTEETRYYLQGVYIEPAPNGGALLTATDGHTLLSFRDPDGRAKGSGIVSLSDALKKELAVTRRDARPRVVMVSGEVGSAFAYVAAVSEGKPIAALFDKATDDVLAAQVSSVLIDGTFPNWRRAIPRDLNPNGPVGAFDSRYLSRMGNALCADQKPPQIIIVPPKENPEHSAHVFFANNQRVEGFGVVMPVRAPDAPPPLPSYLDPPKKKRPASPRKAQAKKAPKKTAAKKPAKKPAKKRRAA